MLTLNELISEATALPYADKAILIEKLVESMATELDQDVLEAGINNAQERIAEIDSGAVQPIPGELALAQNLSQQNVLLRIAGLGNSGQSNISDSDEEILRHEVDPIYGWRNRPENQL